MITVLLASATAVLFGASDFLGGLASRRASAVSVTAWAHMIGAVLFAIALVGAPAPFSAAAVLSGCAAGVASGVGVAALYAALARGRMSLVAPVAAAISGSLPALYDFATGANIGPYAMAGLPLALVATVIVSASSTAEEGATGSAFPPAALAFALLAGVGFAGSFISFSFAPLDSGFWPLAFARFVSVALLAGFGLARTRSLAIASDATWPAAAAGLLDAAANVTMLAAIRTGELAVAAVLGSLFPVVTVVLARVVLGEKLRGVQRVGVVLALVAVVLSSIP